jgi:hypothetical protein
MHKDIDHRPAADKAHDVIEPRAVAQPPRAASMRQPASSAFFVTIKGMGLIFLGITEAIRDYVLGGNALTGIFILQNVKGRRL